MANTAICSIKLVPWYCVIPAQTSDECHLLPGSKLAPQVVWWPRMVKSGQRIMSVGFQSPVHPLLPVEVLGRRELVARVGPKHLASPQRLSFDCFILMASSGGTHGVDFVEIPARPGRLLRVRAGQVQSWDLGTDLDATLVLSAPGASTLQPWFPGDPAATDLDGPDLATATALIDALHHNQQRFKADAATIRLMVALFESLAALFDQSAGTSGPEGRSSVYLAFRSAIEADLADPGALSDRSVAHYAQLIGYSERTLTRACQAATGQTAKQVLTGRLVLEAKRLLSQTEDSVTEIAVHLGFSEPTNFTKFFVRQAGATPRQFRTGRATIQ